MIQEESRRPARKHQQAPAPFLYSNAIRTSEYKNAMKKGIYKKKKYGILLNGILPVMQIKWDFLSDIPVMRQQRMIKQRVRRGVWIEEVRTRTAFCEKRKGNRLCQVQFFH